MKSNKNNMDLEQLLSDVERAGRDARRRDELAAMIDNMAGEAGSRKNAHGFWWWSARVAAAACVLFFISTAIRIWFIPTNTEQSPLVADAGVESGEWMEESTESVDSTAALPVKPAAPRRVAARRHVAHVDELAVEEPQPVIVVEEPLPAVEELLAEEVENQEEEPVEEPEESTVDDIAAPVVSVAYNEPQEQPQEQPRRRSLLGGLFRQPEPDEMTGTVLAFRIL